MFGKTRSTRLVCAIGLLGLIGIALGRPAAAQQSTTSPQNAADQRFWKLYKESHPNAASLDPKYNGLNANQRLYVLAHEPQHPGETVSQETAKVRFEDLYKKYHAKHPVAALKAEKKFDKLYAKEEAKKHAQGSTTGVKPGKKHHKLP